MEPTLTPTWLLFLALALGAIGTYVYMALAREMERDAWERQAAADDALIREQRQRIIELHRALANEEEAGQHRDTIIDALGAKVLSASPLRVIDGGR